MPKWRPMESLVMQMLKLSLNNNDQEFKMEQHLRRQNKWLKIALVVTALAGIYRNSISLYQSEKVHLASACRK